MTHRIERIEYRRGMLRTGAKSDDLPVTAWQGLEIPEDVRSAIQEEGLLDLGASSASWMPATPSSTTS